MSDINYMFENAIINLEACIKHINDDESTMSERDIFNRGVLIRLCEILIKEAKP